MNWTRMPPLNALKSFSALAQSGSYSSAGRTLNVTHAAVKQQVRSLETHLGIALVERSGRGISITPAGQELADSLLDGFSRISQGLDKLTETAAAQPVQVTMSPAFAVKWLMPRLANFQAEHPEITLLLNPAGRFVELSAGAIEIAIRFGRLDAPPANGELLLPVDLSVVATPELVRKYDPGSPSDLVHMPWLQELGTNEAGEWLARRGVAPERPLIISHMPGNLIQDAVRRGDGITYTARQWVADELKTGQLQELFPQADRGGFFVVTLPGELRPPVQKFVDWLKYHAG